MTNRENVDAAWKEILESTISGAEWDKRVQNGYKGKPYYSANTSFGRAKVLLDQVVDSSVPPVPPAPPPPPPVDPPTTKFAQAPTGMLRWGGVAITSNTDKFGFVFAAGGTEVNVCKLPNTRSVIYKSALCADSNTDGRDYGLKYAEARANGWVMLDTSGNEMWSKSYPKSALLDLGNKAMQDKLASNIIAQAKALNCDCVFLDDVVAQGTGYAQSTPAKYGSDGAWETGMVSCVAAVGQKLRAAGFYVIANTYKSGSQFRTADFASRFKAGIDGAMFEGWSGKAWHLYTDAISGLKKLQDAYGIHPFVLSFSQPDSSDCNASVAAFNTGSSGSGGAHVIAPSSGDGWGSWTTQVKKGV